MGFHEDLKQSFQNYKEVFIDPLATSQSELADDYAELASEVATKQDELTAGTGINIVNNVISATGGGGGSGTGGHIIKNASGTALTARETMKFNAPFTATDNSASETTEIGLQQMSSSEMDEIISVLPSGEIIAKGLGDLEDVTITTPSNGQIIKYNSTSRKWENGSGGNAAASDSSYDNTDSGLEADNLQDAIDEVNTNVTSKQNSTDNSLNTTSKNIVGAINEVNSNVSSKQNSTDNSLNTTSKNIVGAINEVNSSITSKQNSTDNSLTTTSKNIVGAINELKTSISSKQNSTDNSLNTTSKTIVGAINELKAGKGSTVTLGGQSVNVSMTLSGDVLTITTS